MNSDVGDFRKVSDFARTRYQALDAARGLAILHMVWFHVHRWSASPSSIQRWRFSVDWWSLVVLSAPPLFFLCFGCGLGLLPWQEHKSLLRPHLMARALTLLVCYKLLFLFELWTLGAPSGSYWPAMTFSKTSGWVEVLSFYSFCLILLPPLIPTYMRLSMPLRWVLFGLLWSAGVRLQSWPTTPATAVPMAFLVGAPGMRPFPLLFWLPIVLIGVSLGQCWRQAPEKVPKLILTHALLLSLGVGWLGEGGFSWQDFHLNIVLNGWKHPPHLAYVGLESANALAWLAICIRLYGLKREPIPASWGPGPDLLRIGRHPLSIYIGHFVVIFGFNSWLHFHGWVHYETSLVLATLALAACIPLARWRDRPPQVALSGRARAAGVLLGLTLICAVAIQSYPQTGPVRPAEFARLAKTDFRARRIL